MLSRSAITKGKLNEKTTREFVLLQFRIFERLKDLKPRVEN